MLSQDLESSLKLSEYAADLVLRQLASVVLLYKLMQVCLLAVFKDQVEVAAGLLEIHQLDDVRVSDHSQRVKFLVDAFQVFLGQVLEADLFDRECAISAYCFEDRGVGTFSYRTQQDVGAHFAALLTLTYFLHNYYSNSCSSLPELKIPLKSHLPDLPPK